MINDKQMEELRKLKELHDLGILSQEEFEQKKQMVLGDTKQSTADVAPEGNAESDEVAEVKSDSVEDLQSASDDSISKLSSEEEDANDNSNKTQEGAKTTEKKKTPIKIIVAVVVALLVVFAVIGASGGDDSEETSTSDYTSEETSDDYVVESISAEYTGSTEEGTVLDDDNDGIEVTGTYDDGTTDTLTAWTVEEPQTLKSGKTSKIKIKYDDLSCELEVKCTTVSKKEFKDSCKTLDYKELARNPDKHKGTNIKIYGQVIQVLEGEDNSVDLRVATKDSGYGSYYDDVVLATYTYDEGESKLLEDDMVTLWGTYGGTYTYEATSGADITVPLLYAEYVER